MNIELTHQQQSVIWIHKCCNYRLDIYPRYLWMSTQQCPILLKQCVQIYQLVEINYDKNTISAQYVFLITHMFDCLASSAVSPAALGNCLLTRDCWTSLSSDWKNKQLEGKFSPTVHKVNLQMMWQRVLHRNPFKNWMDAPKELLKKIWQPY